MEKNSMNFNGDAVLKLRSYIKSRDELVKKEVVFTDVDGTEKKLYLNSIQKQLAKTMVLSLIQHGYLVFIHDKDDTDAEYISGELRISKQIIIDPEVADGRPTFPQNIAEALNSGDGVYRP